MKSETFLPLPFTPTTPQVNYHALHRIPQVSFPLLIPELTLHPTLGIPFSQPSISVSVSPVLTISVHLPLCCNTPLPQFEIRYVRVSKFCCEFLLSWPSIFFSIGLNAMEMGMVPLLEIHSITFVP